MKKSKVLTIAASFLFVWVVGWMVAGLIWWHWESTANDDPGNYKVRFGFVEADSSGNDFLSQETTTIPLKYKDTGFRYGLEIVPPTMGGYTYQCIFHYSAAPKVITGFAFDTATPSTTVRTPEVHYHGTAVEEYWFDPGDPVGEQSVDVMVNDQLVKTIHYTVVPEK